MSRDLWLQIAERLNEHSFMTGVDRHRARVQATAEVFTPTALVVEILKYLDLTLFAPGQSVLDPACGDGQFLVAAKFVKVIHHRMSEEEACADIFGIDLMRDNVDLCKTRLGGGTIVMGNSVDPKLRLPGQTDEEHKLMIGLFNDQGVIRPKKRRLKSTQKELGPDLTFIPTLF